MVNRMRLITLLLTLLTPVPGSAASIDVTTDRDPVVLNESFQLIFESTGRVDDDPDFSPLNRDFQVLSTSVSSNMSIINGSVSSVKRWQLTVLARRPGKLSIPEIHFGRDQSAASTVTVNQATAGSGTRARDADIFIEVQAKPERPYVQAQVIYRVRLFLSVDVANASLTDPVVSGTTAVVEKAGDDSRYQTRRGGKVYDVVERTYAIYPQTSGQAGIEPVVFQAREARGGGFFTNPFGSAPRPVVVQSDPVTLDVQPIPGGFSGSNWLPARKLTLTEDWSEQPPVFRVGTPVTRTLTLVAEGLTSSQLPELPQWSNPDIKQYPDMPALSDTKSSQGITGQRVEKLAMIPNQAGDYTLPAMSLNWWNTATDTMQTVSLPERRIHVQPAAGAATGNGAATPVPLEEPARPQAQAPAAADTAPRPAGPPAPAPPAATLPWPWISLGLLLAWLATLGLWWLGRRRGTGPQAEPESSRSMSRVLRELAAACRANDARAARDRLLQWGRLAWPQQPPASIGAIGTRCGGDLAAEIRILNGVLYAREPGSWDGTGLRNAVREQQQSLGRDRPRPAGELEPLYRL